PYSLFVDSMSSHVILRKAPPGFRVTDATPNERVQHLAGQLKVMAKGEAYLYIRVWHTEHDRWRWVPFLVRNILVVPDASADLYSTRVLSEAFRAAATDNMNAGGLWISEKYSRDYLRSSMALHDFEHRMIHTPFGGGGFEDDGSAYVLSAAFGPKPSKPRAMVSFSDDVAANLNEDEMPPPEYDPLPVSADTPSKAAAPISAVNESGPSAPVELERRTVPQKILWRRLGFPFEAAWRYVTTVTEAHGQPQRAILSTNLQAPEAVVRGRMRALPFMSRPPPDRTLPPPGAVIYLDSCGPMIPSHPHKFVIYSGAIDAGSSYGRLYPCHRMTAEMARSTVDRFVADLSAKMGLAYPIKPQVIISDQGAGYVAHSFREFLAQGQVQHRMSSTYTPEQNHMIERMWGVTFATGRVLLAAANLPPTFHPFALQTARWIHNRLPMPSRGNMSPFSIITRRLAKLAYLFAFGALCEYFVPKARREGDKHFADRGVMGIYLGPSEESPASIVYVVSSKQIQVSRHVRCFEDRFPGVNGMQYDWFPPSIEEGAQQSGTSGTHLISAAAAGPYQTPHRPLEQPSPPGGHPSDRPSPGGQPAAPSPSLTPPFQPPSTPSRLPRQEGATASATEQPSIARPQWLPSAYQPVPRQEGAPSTAPQAVPFNMPTVESEPTGHPLAADPSSVHFDRLVQQPQLKRTRTQATHLNIGRTDLRSKSYVANSGDFSNPLNSSAVGTLTNFCYSAMTAAVASYDMALQYALESTADVSDYASHDAPLAYRTEIKSTAELGDVSIPKSYKQAVACPQNSYWRAAIAKEYEGLVKLGTWTVILLSDVPAGANLMSCHYVFDVKRNQLGEIEKFKARLVADGSTQKFGIDFDRIFSTVVKISTIRLVLAIAAAHDYNLSCADIRQAYLQAELKDDLYMRVPPGHPRFDDKGRPLVLKLNKTLYGLKQSGREWNKLLVAFLISWGFAQSKIDVCLFIYSAAGKVIWLLIWVDDLIIADNDSTVREKFMGDLGERFPTEDKGELTWVVGVHVVRDRPRRALTISQELYVTDLLGRHEDVMGSGH
ncbi:MAG TPA: reverse transcriptase domain-containing protein, partial [Polyangiaceae bacterium LLY-WYZ-15_(1-7)]|nr:reverse transcriptase domain-containing protein [Polyangiaceae bacterium LLY-WYZ-15_(1-7)]